MVGNLTQPFHKRARGRNVSPLPENRLYQDGRGFLGGSLRLQDEFKFVQAKADRGCFIPAVAIGIGKGREEDPGHERLVAHAVHSFRRCEGHGAHGAAVETALKRDNVGAASRMTGQFDAGFYGFRSRV